MNLIRAFRTKNADTISFTGAGGKTTAMFQLAHEYPQAIVTATTHLGAWQTTLADHHIIATKLSDLEKIPSQGVTLITGEIENGRTKPLNQEILDCLRADSKKIQVPLLVESDGSRQKSLKAPASHEPPIPEFADIVIVVAGLSVLGKPLTNNDVHRAEIFSELSGSQINQPITADAITRMLIHPQGGLKNIPPTARRIALLNQADTSESQSLGGGMARNLFDHFDSIVVGALKQNSLQTFERTAGIILAAGESARYGSPKQLLDWKGKPFVRQVAETALQGGLWPVVIVTGSHATEVESCLKDLPVKVIHNLNYQQGQSTSIQAGLLALPRNIGAAVFLLADQPQIPVEVIRALIDSHTQGMQSILAPLVLEDRRANPVLFDRDTFPDLMQLTGDVGGRAIFSKYKVEYIPWHDDILLLDVDNPEDYQRLVENEKL